MNNETGINKSTRIDSNLKLSFLEKVSYGVGDFASNLIWGLISSFLLYFYTDVALIPVAATGTIMIVARILDAFIDPVVGGFIDRTNTKWGRTKPYIMFGIIPLCVVFILTFTTINGSTTAKIIYAYITFIIAGIIYSVVNIPYGALMSLMTKDTDEKTILSSFRMIGMAIGSIFVTACTMPLVNMLGNGNQKRGFILTTIIFSIIGIFCFMIIAKNCKERYLEVASDNHKKANIIVTYKNAFRNSQWIVSIIFALLSFVKTSAFVSITIYFCLQVLHNSAMISIMLPLLYVAIVVASILAPILVKKFRLRVTSIIGLSFFVLSFCIMPFFAENQIAFIAIYFVGQALGGLTNVTCMGMVMNSIDYNEWKFGERTEGTLYAGFSFAMKVGAAIGAALVAYTLAFAGYDANSVTASSAHAINILFYVIPAICGVLQIITVLFYKLDKIHPQIVEELNNKLNNQNV